MTWTELTCCGNSPPPPNTFLLYVTDCPTVKILPLPDSWSPAALDGVKSGDGFIVELLEYDQEFDKLRFGESKGDLLGIRSY